VGLWWRHTPCSARAVHEWITHEFTVRGLSPPDCTPEALARALERERHITIAFQPHASSDPGVYGLLYRPVGYPDVYIIVYRPTHNVVLHRLTLFHELAHILFDHALTEVACIGILRGYMVSDQDDAMAEAFAVGAMQYSFLDIEAPRQSTELDDDGDPSFGLYLQRTGA
jgi:hypothetical protein